MTTIVVLYKSENHGSWQCDQWVIATLEHAKSILQSTDLQYVVHS